MTASTRDSAIERMLLHRSVEDALHHEAELLDTRRFEEWLDLLTEDIRYHMPLTTNVQFGHWHEEKANGSLDNAWFDEGKGTLRKRVEQIMTGLHWSEEPISRISYLITNVQVDPAVGKIEEGGEVAVKCRFLLYRNRMERETDFLVGKREDVLRNVDGAWKVSARRILLDQTVLLAKNLTMFF